jgi:MSHA biogenesis protein MshJ
VKERLAKLAATIDRLSLRERLFVFVALLVVLSGLWEAVLAAPLEARERAAAAKITALQSRLEVLNQSIVSTAEGLSEGMPNQLDRLRALRARVTESDAAVRVYTTDLVDPAQMRAVLEDLLHRQTNLRLVSAENLPVRPLFEGEDGVKPQGAEPPASDPRVRPQGQADQDEERVRPQGGQTRLYRHTLVLRLQGSYLDCLAYLESIEGLPWHLYWTRLELDAGEYPRNDIVLEVQTLSLEEGWIGV